MIVNELQLDYHIFFVSGLYTLVQIPDFYYAYHIYYSQDVIIAFDIYSSFWFLVNGIIGIQYSLFFMLHYIIRYVNMGNQPQFIFGFGLLVILGIGWTMIGFVGFFTKIVPLYIVAKLILQTIVYVFTVGVYVLKN